MTTNAECPHCGYSNEIPSTLNSKEAARKPHTFQCRSCGKDYVVLFRRTLTPEDASSPFRVDAYTIDDFFRDAYYLADRLFDTSDGTAEWVLKEHERAMECARRIRKVKEHFEKARGEL